MRRRARMAAADGVTAPLGRLRKKHPRDCGRPRCQLCSGRAAYVGADRARAKRDWQAQTAAAYDRG